MADSQILSAGSESVPESYVVPANQEILLKTVSAQINGTGASGDFVPTLEIDNGSAAGPWVFVLPQTITAGGSVDVTWGPFPVGAGTTAASGVSGDYQVDPISIAGGAGTFVPWVLIAGTAVLDLTDPTTPTVAVAGTYSVSASINVLSNATTSNYFEIDLRWNWPSASNSHMQDTAYSGVLTDRPYAAVGYTVAMSVGDTFRLLIINRDTASRSFASANVPVTRQA